MHGFLTGAARSVAGRLRWSLGIKTWVGVGLGVGLIVSLLTSGGAALTP